MERVVKMTSADTALQVHLVPDQSCYMIGRKIDNYLLKEILGIGTMAMVYKALDMISGETVAVKMVDPTYFSDQNKLKCFKGGIKKLTKSKHPYVVKVYKFLQEEDDFFIVMEYVPGERLDEYIQKYRPISCKDTLSIFDQILQATEYAHKHDVFHRSIKPSNIIINDRGFVKVMDFGLETAHLHNSDCSPPAHILKYLSPERVRLSPNINYQRDDIYSLGMTFYEISAGRTPFEEMDNEKVLQDAILGKNLVSPDKINPKIPMGLARIIMQAIAKEPNDRYKSVVEMLAVFKEFQESYYSHSKHQQISPPPNKPVPLQTPPGLRKRNYIWLSAVFVCLIFISLLSTVLNYKQILPNFLFTEKTFLSVITDPDNVQVFINERFVGKSPLSSYQVEPGVVSVKLEKKNFFPVDTTFILKKSSSSTFSHPLQPAAFASIEVSPTDAVVLLDKKTMRAADRKDLFLDVGPHLIEISKAGYVSTTKNINLAQGRNPAINITLKKKHQNLVAASETKTTTIPRVRPAKPEPAALNGIRLNSIPQGATIWLDGRDFGITPKTVLRIKPGKHKIALRKKGYKEYSRTVVSQNKKIISIAANLQPAMGRLEVFVKPYGSIYIDGERRKKNWDVKYTTEISAGPHLLRLEHPFFGFLEKTVKIDSEQTLRVDFNFNRKARLTVLAFDRSNNIVYGEILLDGQFIGRYTPSELELQVGQHKIAVRHSDYFIAEQEINLESERGVRLVLHRKLSSRNDSLKPLDSSRKQ